MSIYLCLSDENLPGSASKSYWLSLHPSRRVLWRRICQRMQVLYCAWSQMLATILDIWNRKKNPTSPPLPLISIMEKWRATSFPWIRQQDDSLVRALLFHQDPRDVFPNAPHMWLVFFSAARLCCFYYYYYFVTDILNLMDVDTQPTSSSSGEANEHSFDCVICGQTSTSTERRPVGLVALLQPSTGDYIQCLQFSSAQQVKEFFKLIEHSRSSLIIMSVQCIIWIEIYLILVFVIYRILLPLLCKYKEQSLVKRMYMIEFSTIPDRFRR